MFDKIRETQRINEIIFPSDGGQCFYYSKLTLTFSLFANFAITIVGIILSLQLDNNVIYSIIGIIAVLFSIHNIFSNILPRLLFKNPLFIIYNNSLFCSKNNLVFNLMDSDAIKFKAHKQYFTSYLRIQRRDKINKFDELLFWIKESDLLVEDICKKQGIKRLPWLSEMPIELN